MPVSGLARSIAGAIDWLKVSIPGLRGLFVELYLTQMFWVLGLSLGHGVSVPDALRAARDAQDPRFDPR